MRRSRPPRHGKARLSTRVPTLLTLVALLFVATAGPSSVTVAGSASTSPEQKQWTTMVSAPSAVPPSTAATSPAALPALVPDPPPSASSMPPSVPVRLRIPAIDVDADLIELGLRDDGRLQVPQDAFPAGWYDGSPTPGEVGPAIISGHVDYGGQQGVFYDLRAVAAADVVAVERTDGSTAVFRVTRVEQYPKDEFPTDAVYGDLDHAGLRLITCGGSFDRQARSYVDNIVVFGELVTPAHVTPP